MRGFESVLLLAVLYFWTKRTILSGFITRMGIKYFLRN
jgi:hypothetical protein